MKTLSLKTIALALSLATTGAFGADYGAPFEQTQFDRALNAPQTAASQAASSGATVITSRGGLASGVWANDQNFIAPAL